MDISIKVLIFVVSFYIFVQGFNDLSPYFKNIHFNNIFKRRDEEEVGVEIPVSDYVKPKYDVSAFRTRIRNMTDEDGLFDVMEVVEDDEFTGTEVITADAETDIEKYVRR